MVEPSFCSHHVTQDFLNQKRDLHQTYVGLLLSKSNIIHSTCFAAKTIAPDIRNASQTDFELKKKKKGTKIGHLLFFCKERKCTSTCCCLQHFVEYQCPDWRGIKSVVSSCDLFFISYLLFFLFVSWTNQAALKRDAGCMRDGNCWGFFSHESNDHWSSPQRTHRHHQQVTQSTKRRAQLSTRRTYLFPLRQHASLARIHGHLCHRHRGNALKQFYTWRKQKNHLGCTETQHHWPRVIAESVSTKIPITMSLTKYPDSYSQRRLLLFSSSRWMGVKFFRSHRRRHFGHCVSGCRSFPVPTAPWCC